MKSRMSMKARFIRAGFILNEIHSILEKGFDNEPYETWMNASAFRETKIPTGLYAFISAGMVGE